MRFVEAQIEDFKFYKKTKLQKVLTAFVDSGYTIAEVLYDEGEYKSVSAALSSLSGAIKRFKVHSVEARVIDKRLYLVNKILFDKKVGGEQE